MDPRAAVGEIARRTRYLLHTSAVLEDATTLLTTWWGAAQEHGVDPAHAHGPEWLIRLAGTALEMAESRAVLSVTRSERQCEQLLEMLCDRGGARGLSTAPIPYLVVLERTASTPAWGRTGSAELGIGIDPDRGGWILTLEQIQAAPSIRVAGRCDGEGIDAVLDLATAVNNGAHGNVFAHT